MNDNTQPAPARRTGNPLADLLRDPGLYFWCALLLAGFAYVAGVLCGRSNPLASRHGANFEACKLMAVAPFLYYVSARQVLEPFREHPGRALLCYVLPYFAALHWFYLQKISVVNYSLTPRDLITMPLIGKVVFLLGGLPILALIAYHVRLASRAGILWPYLGTFVGAIAALPGITWVLRNHYSWHIHHYFLFGFFIPWARFQTIPSTMAHAFCTGVFVEGVSEWSMATLWYPKQ